MGLIWVSSGASTGTRTFGSEVATNEGSGAGDSERRGDTCCCPLLGSSRGCEEGIRPKSKSMSMSICVGESGGVSRSMAGGGAGLRRVSITSNSSEGDFVRWAPSAGSPNEGTEGSGDLRHSLLLVDTRGTASSSSELINSKTSLTYLNPGGGSVRPDFVRRDEESLSLSIIIISSGLGALLACLEERRDTGTSISAISIDSSRATVGFFLALAGLKEKSQNAVNAG